MTAPVRGRLRALWRRLRRPAPGVLTVGPARGLRFDPAAGDPACATGDYELSVQEALAAHLGTGDVVLDVGANVGFFAVVCAHLVGPIGRVVAFEPVPANAAAVRRNAWLNGLSGLEVVLTAVGDRCGKATLVLARHAGGAALSDCDRPPDACGECEVPLTTLDDWLRREGARLPGPVKLVKIDVEGAELAVLHGARALLERVKPLLLIELDDPEPAGVAVKTEACRAFCEERGYAVSQLPDAYPGLAWQVRHLLAVPRSRP